MKKYMKNKDFIPEEFYKEKESRTNRNEKNIIAVFIIINLCFIPYTSKSMWNIEEKTRENIVDTENIKRGVVSMYDISTWVECVIKSEIEEAYITVNEGEILVDNFDEINKISSNKQIKINDINLNSDNKYRLGVSLNE